MRNGYAVLLAVAALVWAAALALTDYPLVAYLSTLGRGRFIALWFIPPVLWLAWLGAAVVRRRSARPIETMARLTVRRRYWLARGFGFGLLLIPLSIAFTALKRTIPEIVPYYADPWLAEADRLLFLGHEPWRLTHALVGPFGTAILDRIYLLWFPSSAILLGCFLFARDQRFQLRGLLSYVLTWFLLGSFAATALASVGPVYYEAFFASDRFVPMIASLAADDAVIDLWAPVIQEGLYRGFGGSFIGSGISAMPSLHVAMACLLFLAASPRYRPVAAIYLALIWIGSVHLGWHYAVDGLVSVVAVGAIWHLTGSVVYRSENRANRDSQIDRDIGTGAKILTPA